jgi:hypothetical protein
MQSQFRYEDIDKDMLILDRLFVSATRSTRDSTTTSHMSDGHSVRALLNISSRFTLPSTAEI